MPSQPSAGRIRELQRKLAREAGWLKSRRTSAVMRNAVARAYERHRVEYERLTGERLAS